MAGACAAGAHIGSSHCVVVDHESVCGRDGLTGENEAALHFPIFKAVIDRHGDGAFDDASAAGRAHAGGAGVRRLEPGRKCGIEKVLAGRQQEAVALAVEDRGRENTACGVF